MESGCAPIRCARTAGGAAPVDEPPTTGYHDHIVRVKVAVTQAFPRRETLDHGDDAGGDWLGKRAIGDMQATRHRFVQAENIGRRGPLVDGALSHRIIYDTSERCRMPTTHPPEIPAFFYRTSGGSEPVLDWLRSLPPEDRRVIGTDLATVQFGWPIGMPLCRPLGGGMWEVRSTLPSRRIARLVFFVDEGCLGVVHGFIKKTQKTPAEDLDLARKRMKEMKA